MCIIAYTVGEIKVFAYNFDEKDDFTAAEFNLFIGLAYAYEWYRANPDDKEDCMQLMNTYIESYEMSKKIDGYKPLPRPSWLDRAKKQKNTQNTEQPSKNNAEDNTEDNTASEETQKGSA